MSVEKQGKGKRMPVGTVCEAVEVSESGTSGGGVDRGLTGAESAF